MGPHGSVILLYHRIAEPGDDPFGLSVSPDRFVEQLAVLRATDVRPLSEATRRSSVAITFDDGYADNALVAAPLLRAARLPATFFVTAGQVGTGQAPWWDRLVRLVEAARGSVPFLDLVVAGRPLWADVRSPPARQRALLALQARLRSLSPAAIERELDGLAGRLGVPAERREEARLMTVDELRALARDRLFEIGSHTLDHPALASLSPDGQRREIEGSRDLLRGMLRRPIDTFAYPFGGDETFDDTTTGLLHQAGYRLACTTDSGRAGRRTDAFRLPRYVVGDWGGPVFAEHLHDWMGDAVRTR